MQTALLQLSVIVTDAGTQIRAKVCEDTVAQYAAEMLEGAKFPPVDVFHDGNQFILADGFHRVMAASRNGFKDIEADVRKGTKSDALKFALSANATHGIKRTNPDKRRSVELALAEWPKLSDVELSRICAVSTFLVQNVRSETQPLENRGSPRQGADGKIRKVPAPKSKDITPQQAAALMANVPKSEPIKTSHPSDGGELRSPLKASVAPSSFKPYMIRIDEIIDEAAGDLDMEEFRKLVANLDVSHRRAKSIYTEKAASALTKSEQSKA